MWQSIGLLWISLEIAESTPTVRGVIDVASKKGPATAPRRPGVPRYVSLSLSLPLPPLSSAARAQASGGNRDTQCLFFANPDLWASLWPAA